jgi:hypothetical protein
MEKSNEPRWGVVAAQPGWYLVGLNEEKQIVREVILGWRVMDRRGYFDTEPVTLHACKENTQDELRLILAPDGTYHDRTNGEEFATEAAAIEAMVAASQELKKRNRPITLADEKRCAKM